MSSTSRFRTFASSFENQLIMTAGSFKYSDSKITWHFPWVLCSDILIPWKCAHKISECMIDCKLLQFRLYGGTRDANIHKYQMVIHFRQTNTPKVVLIDIHYDLNKNSIQWELISLSLVSYNKIKATALFWSKWNKISPSN